MGLIVIDGIDCVGKETQCKLLSEYLVGKGYSVCVTSLPYYNNNTGKLLKEYLSGKLALDVYEASKLFAKNRLEVLKDLKVSDYDYVIFDRYNTANIIHQGAKLSNLEDKVAYIDWLKGYEHNKLGLPLPDKVILLHLDVNTSNKLLKARGNKCGIFQDIHETDITYRLSLDEHIKWVSSYLGYELIDCNDGSGNIRSKGDILIEILGKLGE